MVDKVKTKPSKVMIGIGLAIVVVLVTFGIAWYRHDATKSRQTGTPSTHNQTTDSSANSNSSDKPSGDEISRAQAEQIATDKYGGTVKETESDDYHGKPAWEVEIRDSREGRIEVKVDKITGEILDLEHD